MAAVRAGDGARGRAIAEQRVLESGERLIAYLSGGLVPDGVKRQRLLPEEEGEGLR